MGPQLGLAQKPPKKREEQTQKLLPLPGRLGGDPVPGVQRDHSALRPGPTQSRVLSRS